MQRKNIDNKNIDNKNIYNKNVHSGVEENKGLEDNICNTLGFYNDNAKKFIEGTINADMSEARNRFLENIPSKGLILDWGCGSGRDSLAFMETGFQVEAVDGSEKLCELLTEKLGQRVRCESFEELTDVEKFDGIWACASLLHVEKVKLSKILEIAKKALKKNGCMYLSFKYGDFEGMRNGRYFTDMTEEGFDKIIKKIEDFEIQEEWITGDVRQDRGTEKWLNVILIKC